MLRANTTLQTATGDLNVGSVDGAFALALNSGGSTRITGTIGGGTPLTSLTTDNNAAAPEVIKPIRIMSRDERLALDKEKHDKTVVRLPAYDVVKDDPVMYAHASRVFHLESNPGNARAMVQAHGERDVWLLCIRWRR